MEAHALTNAYAIAATVIGREYEVHLNAQTLDLDYQDCCVVQAKYARTASGATTLNQIIGGRGGTAKPVHKAEPFGDIS
jgi:hypothetical protein